MKHYIAKIYNTEWTVTNVLWEVTPHLCAYRPTVLLVIFMTLCEWRNIPTISLYTIFSRKRTV